MAFPHFYCAVLSYLARWGCDYTFECIGNVEVCMCVCVCHCRLLSRQPREFEDKLREPAGVFEDCVTVKQRACRLL